MFSNSIVLKVQLVSISHFTFTVLPGGTLVICPASLLKQWELEVERRCRRNSLTVHLHHGAKRETVRPKYLAGQDMVITTYNIVSRDHIPVKFYIF